TPDHPPKTRLTAFLTACKTPLPVRERGFLRPQRRPVPRSTRTQPAVATITVVYDETPHHPTLSLGIGDRVRHVRRRDGPDGDLSAPDWHRRRQRLGWRRLLHRRPRAL